MLTLMCEFCSTTLEMQYSFQYDIMSKYAHTLRTQSSLLPAAASDPVWLREQDQETATTG